MENKEMEIPISETEREANIKKLKELGFQEDHDDPITRMFCDLTPDSEEEDKIMILINAAHGVHPYQLLLPDGKVNLNIQALEDLAKVKSLILGYEPNY